MLSKSTIRGFYLACVAAVAASFGGATPARGNIIINANYANTNGSGTSQIANDPNAAAIEATINADIAFYESVITNNITVNLNFYEMNSGLGESTTYVYTTDYQSYYNALAAVTSKSANDITALAHLPNQSANPVNGGTSIQATGPLLRALGIDANSGTYDTAIGLKTSIMNLSRTGTQNGSFYDLESVAAHEMDEALGIGSGLTGTANGGAAPTTIEPEDLFRYSSTSGVRSYTTSASAAAYFSIDGTSDLVQFNQNSPAGAPADYNDWYSYPSGGNPPRVQDAYSSPGAEPNLDSELEVLDVMGYTLVPEPGMPALFVTLGVGGLLRRRKARAV